MKIARFRPCGADGSDPGGQLGRIDGDRIIPLAGSTTLAAALTAALDGTSTAAAVDVASVELLAPTDGLVSLRDCVGFLQHVRNTRRSRGVTDPLPEMWHQRPAFYFANPASVRSATADIAIPAGSVAFDFELEIGAVIGRTGRDLSVSEAADHIAGYVLYCDWSARDAQAEERALQIGQGKGKDAAISLGPWVLGAAEAGRHRVEDGFAFEVSVSVNGSVVHAGDFRGMDWTFEELVAYASLGSEVRPGDLIASGTLPLCCLLEHSADEDFRGWLQPGDVVRLDGGPLGIIETTIQAPVGASTWRRTPVATS